MRELFRDNAKATLEFSVECLGIVIDQERLQVLFQPYDYLKSRIEQDVGSIDIALVILKNYALAMGADTLTAESDEGRGTKLSITLTVPLAEEDPKADEMCQSEYDFQGLRVLIADDNEINLEVGETLLFSRGCDVVSAINGQDAVDSYIREQGRFDLIIMDIVMPVMDGLEAAKRIREMTDIPGSDTIPIIAMTADAFKDNFEESFQAGMSAHLVKPISPERLYSVMADVLSKNGKES